MGKVKIGTAERTLAEGRVCIGGPSWTIKEGRVKVGAVVYPILLKKEMYTITIKRYGSGTSGVPYVKINNKTYRGSSSEDTVLEFEERTELLFVAAGETSTSSIIYLNDNPVAYGDSSGNAARYTMELTSDLAVLLDKGSSYYARIYITEV